MEKMKSIRFQLGVSGVMLLAALLCAGWLAAPQAQAIPNISVVPAPAPLNLGNKQVDVPAGQSGKPLPPQLEGVGIKEHLHRQVPLEIYFTNAEGKKVKFSSFFHKGKPVLLDLGYYRCPMLCPRIWAGMAQVLKKMEWVPGKQFQIVTLSIDPRDTPEIAQSKKQLIMASMGRKVDTSGWHWLVGKRPEIQKLANAVGFGYSWDPQTQQYNHQAALIILSPDGKVMRYLYGITYSPTTLKYALIQAGQGNVGSTLDKIILWCCRYDPNTGKYTYVAMKVMQLGGGLTLVFLVGCIGFLLLLEARKRKRLAARVAARSQGERPGKSDGASP